MTKCSKLQIHFKTCIWVLYVTSNIMLLSCSAERYNSRSDFIGVVSSATPEASVAGKQILLQGGNAVDAAVAVSFALAVTESPMSGLGGGTQVLLSIENGLPISINGSTLSPSSTPNNVDDTLTYHRRSTIPSTVKVLEFIWRNYGSGNVAWEDLLAPAIDLAENGYVLGAFRAKVYQKYSLELKKSRFNTHLFFNINGEIPEEGDTIVQKLLAKTLKRIAKHGASDFYSGKIARQISQDMKQHNGWITLEDLKNFPEPSVLSPLQSNIGDYLIYTQPPPCGGWVMLLASNILSQTKIDEKSAEDIIEALYLAHNDRDNKPVKDLINYEEDVHVKLSKEYAKNLKISKKESFEVNEKDTGETTHFSIVDSKGSVIAVTSSINAYFGAMAASDSLGFLYNTYMDDFVFNNPTHPFAIQPNSLAYSSMTPTIVQQNGQNVLVLGSPGSSRIISSVAQIIAKWIQQGNIQNCVSEPRIHVSKNNIYMENIVDTISVNKDFLKQYELQFRLPNKDLINENNLNPYFGGIHAIAKEDGNWQGVADPRRDGESINVKK